MSKPPTRLNDPFANGYPHIARWVRECGWIGIGDDEASGVFIRALDPGGMVWSGGSPERPLSDNLRELDTALAAWMIENLTNS